MGLSLFGRGLSIFENNIAGSVWTNDGTKTTILGVVGDYLRIGDAATTGHALDSEDDLMVTGDVEVDGSVWLDGSVVIGTAGFTSGSALGMGAANITFNAAASYLGSAGSDANAKSMDLYLNAGAGNNTPVFRILSAALWALDSGLFDGLTQPTVAVLEKAGKYAAVANATSTGADVAVLTTATAGTFTNAVVGDIVRVTAGTNATVGWYWITTATDQYNVTLDRNWCTGGAVSGGTIVCYHDFTMLSADGVCTRITDGAPDDNSVEIDRAGWLILDVGQANGRLYWRTGAAWHYVDATAGLSMPAAERIDPKGKEFKLGTKVDLFVDRINDDGSFHAMPYVAK